MSFTFETTSALRDHLVKTFGMAAGLSDQAVKDFAAERIADGKLDLKTVRELASGRVKEVVKEALRELQREGSHNMNASTSGTGPTAADWLGGGNGAGSVRVKRASEWYTKETKTGLHVRTNQPVSFAGAPVCHPSELALAKIGVFAKHALRSHSELLREKGVNVPDLKEHEQQLLHEVINEDFFCGEKANGEWIDRATIEQAGLSKKALFDDSTSGGQNLVPFEFDKAVITFPMLHSEILPHVEVRDCGSSEVKTATVGNVTVAWGAAEGTDISLFNTDSLCDPLAAVIFPVSAAIIYGKDFLADTPVADFGATLVRLFGQANLQELDKVICVGNGTNQPEGIFTATGTVSVESDNDTTGPPSLGDYVRLQFGIGKQYRLPAFTPMYLSNDTTYMRSRQLKVDPATPSTDQRLLLGMELQSYSTLGFGHAVNNSVANTKIAFGAMQKYRLYRRSGFDFFATDKGEGLARRNEVLLVARGRYGGIVTDPNAFAVMTDAQS